jgi:hypothetical protein
VTKAKDPSKTDEPIEYPEHDEPDVDTSLDVEVDGDIDAAIDRPEFGAQDDPEPTS